jgi:hypothetical protein
MRGARVDAVTVSDREDQPVKQADAAHELPCCEKKIHHAAPRFLARPERISIPPRGDTRLFLYQTQIAGNIGQKGYPAQLTAESRLTP